MKTIAEILYFVGFFALIYFDLQNESVRYFFSIIGVLFACHLIAKELKLFGLKPDKQSVWNEDGSWKGWGL